jgi:hypothetical protein
VRAASGAAWQGRVTDGGTGKGTVLSTAAWYGTWLAQLTLALMFVVVLAFAGYSFAMDLDLAVVGPLFMTRLLGPLILFVWVVHLLLVGHAFIALDSGQRKSLEAAFRRGHGYAEWRTLLKTRLGSPQ